MEKVKKEGETISKGGITYIKKEHEKELTEQDNEQDTKQTEQKEDRKHEDQKEKKEKKSTKPLQKSKISNDFLLSELEFKNFENAFNVVYQSNLKRLQNYRATGILNALNICKNTIEIMKERGNFK